MLLVIDRQPRRFYDLLWARRIYALSILLVTIRVRFILLFTFSSPCRKDQFAVSYFLWTLYPAPRTTDFYGLIQSFFACMFDPCTVTI